VGGRRQFFGFKQRPAATALLPPCAPDAKSKTLAERAAWDFVRTLPPSRAFELAAVCPGMMLGHALGGGAFSSGELVRKVLCGDFPMVPAMQMTFVDVRDAALVHIAAMVHPAAAGRRFLAIGPTASLDVIGPYLAAEFAQYGYSVPTYRMPDWLLRVVGCFDRGAAVAAKRLGMRGTRLNGLAARAVLGVTFSEDLRTIVVATARGVIAHGLAPDRSAGRILSTGRSPAEVARGAAPVLPAAFDAYKLPA
jgi:dihydroflavonol-4-reductase